MRSAGHEDEDTKGGDTKVTEATSYGPTGHGAVKSAGRVLQILEMFDDIQRDARVAEIAERLSLPQSSTSILLRSLVDLGFMDYLPERRSFLPSPRVTLLGTWLDKGPVRNGSLTRMLEDISQQTGDTVIIAARSGIFSQYIHVLAGAFGDAVSCAAGISPLGRVVGHRLRAPDPVQRKGNPGFVLADQCRGCTWPAARRYQSCVGEYPGNQTSWIFLLNRIGHAGSRIDCRSTA